MTASSLPAAEGQPQPVERKTFFTKENIFIIICLFAIVLCDIGIIWFWKRPQLSAMSFALMAGGGLIAFIPFFIGLIGCVRFYQWYGFWVLVLMLFAASPLVWGLVLPVIHWKRYGLRQSLWCLLPVAAWVVSFPLLSIAPLPGFSEVLFFLNLLSPSAWLHGGRLKLSSPYYFFSWN